MSEWEALALTLGFEIPVVVLIARFFELDEHLLRVIVVAAAASLVTHPLAWYLALDALYHWPFWPRAAVIEPAVVAVETVVYARALKTRWKLAAGMALAANIVSFVGGLVVIRLI